MGRAAFEIVDLVKRYREDGPPANDRLTLTISEGEVFGLLGPNGAGKSTLVRQLAGLTRPTSGRITLFGADVIKEPQVASRLIALQPQGLALPMQARPPELLEITGRLRGLSAAAAKHETEELMSQFGLTPHAGKLINDLSGGLRRLTAIATTLIGSRPILILDEPTNELDPQIRRTIWERIRRVAGNGATVILVTHNVVEAEEALDRVAIIRGGRIISMGTPGELKSQVSRQIRLDLVFRPDGEESAEEILEGWPDVYRIGAHRYAVIVPQKQAEQRIAHLLPHLNQLDDFRVVTPNLEDVYLELTGGESIGA